MSVRYLKKMGTIGVIGNPGIGRSVEMQALIDRGIDVVVVDDAGEIGLHDLKTAHEYQTLANTAYIAELARVMQENSIHAYDLGEKPPSELDQWSKTLTPSYIQAEFKMIQAKKSQLPRSKRDIITFKHERLYGKSSL